MRKIINGRMYNTETAKCRGTFSDGAVGDFRHYVETLYCKKTGEFFLYGEGGPMTAYAERAYPNGYCGGRDIVPLTDDEARRWAEKHLTVDEYIACFGDVEE